MSNFGSSVVQLTHISYSGAADDLGHQGATETITAAAGCRHRPLTFRETAELEIDIATQPWRTTLPMKNYDAPTLAALLALKNNDVITVDGLTYKIIGGVRPFPDRFGNPFKATIISQIQRG